MLVTRLLKLFSYVCERVKNEKFTRKNFFSDAYLEPRQATMKKPFAKIANSSISESNESNLSWVNSHTRTIFTKLGYQKITEHLFA